MATAHKDFTDKLNNISKNNNLSICRRIIYNNNAQKWKDIYEVKDGDLSRTLLGIEQELYIKGETNAGYFVSPSHCLDDRVRRNKIDEMLIKAYKEWELKKEDKIIMTVGLVDVLEYNLSDLEITNEQYNSI